MKTLMSVMRPAQLQHTVAVIIFNCRANSAFIFLHSFLADLRSMMAAYDELGGKKVNK